MKIHVTKSTEVDAKVLKLRLQVRDEFTATLVDRTGEAIRHQDDGYVPRFMPGNHFGDYVILDIDIETGQVLNWTKPSEEDLQTWVNVTG